MTPRNRERVLVAVQRDAQADEALERLGPARPRRVERLHGGLPIHPVRVDAAEQHAVLEDRVDAEDRPVDSHPPRPPVDAEQAGDATSPQQPERVEHQLRVARRLDHDVEAADDERAHARLSAVS